MPPPLYYREFTRNGLDDRDHRVNQEFLNANFVDHFGKWLQTGDNASIDTFNDLINVFWGEYMLLTAPMVYTYDCRSVKGKAAAGRGAHVHGSGR